MKKKLTPKTENQRIYLESLQRDEIIFVDGPAGCGKSYMATVYGICELLEGRVEKLLIGRPLVQTDIESGFLPGTLEDKLEPYLRPIMDILSYSVSPSELQKLIQQKKIEVAAIGYLQGRTFFNSFVIMDEMQNSDFEQIKLVLTRLGKSSKIVLTADLSQSYIPKSRQGGMAFCMEKLQNIPKVGIIRMEKDDIQRHPLIKTILERLDDDSGTITELDEKTPER